MRLTIHNLVHHARCWPTVVGFVSGFLSLCQAARGPAGGTVLSRSGSKRDHVRSGTTSMLPRKIIPLAWRNLTENRGGCGLRGRHGVRGDAHVHGERVPPRDARQHGQRDRTARRPGRRSSAGPSTRLALPYAFPLSPDRSRRRASPEVRSRQPGLRRDPARLLAEPPDRLARADLRDRRAAGKRRARLDRGASSIARRWANPTPCWPTSSRGRPDSATSCRAQVSELSGHRVRVVGTFKLGIDAQSNGNLIMSERNLLRLFPEHAGARWVRTPSPSACSASARAPIPTGCEPSSRRPCPPTSAC